MQQLHPQRDDRPGPADDADVLAIPVVPPKAPVFIKGKNNRAAPAAFEQSLHWVDVVDTGGFSRFGMSNVLQRLQARQ